MKNLRNDFPIYRNNTKLVYLDYAATTFMPDNVISAWHDFHSNIGVSINRGSGILSDKASEIYYNSKKELLNLGVIDYKLDSGNIIRVYDLDKTICDIIKNNNDGRSQKYRFGGRNGRGNARLTDKTHGGYYRPVFFSNCLACRFFDRLLFS